MSDERRRGLTSADGDALVKLAPVLEQGITVDALLAAIGGENRDDAERHTAGVTLEVRNMLVDLVKYLKNFENVQKVLVAADGIDRREGRVEAYCRAIDSLLQPGLEVFWDVLEIVISILDQEPVSANDPMAILKKDRELLEAFVLALKIPISLEDGDTSYVTARVAENAASIPARKDFRGASLPRGLPFSRYFAKKCGSCEDEATLFVNL